MPRLSVYAILLLVTIHFVLPIFAPPLLLVNKPGFSQAVFDRNRLLLRLTLSSDEKFRLWTPLKQISPDLIEATLNQEDRLFYWHFGVNPLSLLRALKLTYGNGRRVGGSTITMQLARMRFGIRSQSIGGKLRQIFYALLLETAFSKKQILEAYLNLASYGGNIEGIGAASLIYFSKPASQLNQAESNLLSVIPQSPKRRIPIPGQANIALNQARERLIGRSDTEQSSEQILQVSSNASKSNLPFEAPHLVERLLQKHPFESQITSTIDLHTQNAAEALIKQFVTRNHKIGIQNASAMAIDFTSMQPIFYIGSADYFNREISGQVDGITARRSPGSALKPFIYALALEQGLIHPNSLLKDVPYSRAAYNPENFDREFVGPISATDALIRSRNVPAVNLLNQVGPQAFLKFLQSGQVKQLRSIDFYGLSLALGGVEIRLDELVALYATLANAGEWHALQMDLNSSAPASKHTLLGPDSSYLTLLMLRENPRLVDNVALSQYFLQRPIAWKTGTSHGFRDAWAVGIVGQFVLAVWVGNFSGVGNKAFIGRETAGPLFFSLADLLRKEPNFSDPASPKQTHVKKVTVCAVSGELPGPQCKQLRESWFIPGKSPIGTCSIHREILIDSLTGLRGCPDAKTLLVPKVYEFWPSDLLQLFREGGIPRRGPPEFLPLCRGGSSSGLDPKITSPDQSLDYLWLENQPCHMPLHAVGDADSQSFYWFIDDTFVGKTPPETDLIWDCQPGEFLVRVIDQNGRSASSPLRVRLQMAGKPG